jgi:hypothetical protein
MTDTLFISENKLKNFSDLNNALDPSLITKVKNSEVVGNYLTLMGFVQDALLYWSYYEALESIYLRPRNNGLLVPQGGQEATAADVSLYDKKRTSVENKAEWYSERLVGWLIDNGTLFPEFQTETGMEIFPDQSSQFKTPFVMSRDKYVDQMKKMGIKVTDSRYKYLPQ